MRAHERLPHAPFPVAVDADQAERTLLLLGPSAYSLQPIAFPSA